MGQLVYVCYPLLFILLLWGAKFYGRKSWNNEFMSLSQTKALQGFCAICVMLHHIGQKTCAPWLKQEFIVHGLDVFVPIGYFFVGIFLFCSGYGLYKSYREKENYLQGFFGRRILPLILAFVSTSFIFLVVRIRMGDVVGLSQPFRLSGPQLMNQYAWFVFALMLFYIGFFLAFRYCRSEKAAIWMICLVVFGYIVYCDWWMYGGWWYNSVLLFVVGLFFARYEEKIVEEVKRRYVLYVMLSFLLTVVFFIFSECAQEVFDYFWKNANHTICRWAILLSQMAAACAFVFLLVLLGMKIKIGNRVLAFMGTMTLEFYLIHGLFVQLFGYSFIDDQNAPLYYIKNVALMVLVVSILSIASAYVLQRMHKLIAHFLIKRKEMMTVIRKDMKKIALGLLAVVLVLTLFTSISSHRKSQDAKEAVTIYAKENITYTEVGSEKMSAYVTGEGEHTIVLLCGLEDFCPTITLKPIADALAEKNRVIILDNLGRGFSDDTDKERTADNLVYEVHTALKGLGEEGPYILMPHQSSGIYAQLYTYIYPEEVEAVIAMDSYVAKQMDEMIEMQRMVPQEYERMLKKQGGLYYLGQRFLTTTGYVRTQWNVYKTLFTYNTKSELDVLEEMFVDRYCGKSFANEMAHGYQNAYRILDQKYAHDLPVLCMLAHYSCEGYTYGNLDWERLHSELFTNTDIQKITILSGSSYFVYYNAHFVADKAQEFIDELGARTF